MPSKHIPPLLSLRLQLSWEDNSEVEVYAKVEVQEERGEGAAGDFHATPTLSEMHSHLSITEVSGLCDDLLEQDRDIVCRERCRTEVRDRLEGRGHTL